MDRRSQSQTGLRALAPGLWVAEDEIRVAGLPTTIRMTVLQRPEGLLVLHSPVEISDALAEALDAIGPVRELIAPNRLHHLFLLGAQGRWPDARLWGVPGLPAKRPDLVFDAVFGASTPVALADTVECQLIAGCPSVSEVAFFHPPSRTLILTDLVFNVHHSPSLVGELYLRASGAWRRCAQTPLMRALVADRDAVRRSYARLFDWDFERLIMAHGDIIEGQARAALRRALA